MIMLQYLKSDHGKCITTTYASIEVSLHNQQIRPLNSDNTQQATGQGLISPIHFHSYNKTTSSLLSHQFLDFQSGHFPRNLRTDKN
jgi:hypothetical protein